MGAITVDGNTVVSLGDVAGAVGIIVVSLVGLVRWLRRQTRKMVEPIVREVTSNGGSTMKDEVAQLVEAHTKLDRQVRRLFAERRADAQARADRQADLDRTLEALRGQLAALRPVLEDYLISHPEARRLPPDVDDDRSST